VTPLAGTGVALPDAWRVRGTSGLVALASGNTSASTVLVTTWLGTPSAVAAVAAATWTATGASVTTGAVLVSAAVAVGTWSGNAASVAPGAVSTVAGVASGAWSAVAATVSATSSTAAGAASGAWTGLGATVTQSGGLSTDAAAATSTWSGVAATCSVFDPGNAIGFELRIGTPVSQALGVTVLVDTPGPVGSPIRLTLAQR